MEVGPLSTPRDRYARFLEGLTESERTMFYIAAFATEITARHCFSQDKHQRDGDCATCGHHDACKYADILSRHVQRTLNFDDDAFAEMIDTCLDDAEDFENLMNALQGRK